MDSHADSMLIESELIVPVSIEFRNDLSPDDFEQLCRLCGNSSPQLMPIFSADGNEHNLPDKIREHLPIIKVSKTDVLPLSICYQCASTLISWHELYYACKDADLRLNEIYSRFKLEKIEPEENLIEIDDDVDFSEHVDSYEPVEFPVKPATPLKPEVIIPSALSEETTRLTADFSKTTESNVCSKPIEIPLAVDNEARKSPSADTKNKSARVTDAELITGDAACLGPSTRSPQSPSAEAANTLLSVATGDRPAPLSPADLSALSTVELPHPRTEPGGRYRCDKCDRRFSSRAFLNMHYNEGRVVFASPATFHKLYTLMRAHPLVPPDRIDSAWPFACALCDQRFETKAAVRVHIYCYHPALRKFRCDFCASCFVTECDLAEHRVGHSAERQLVCLGCGGRRTTGSLPYETDRARLAYEMCGCRGARQHPQVVLKAAARRRPAAEVRLERERKERERDERKRRRQEALEALGTVCQECGKQFPTRLSLKRHHRLHKNPSECEFCGKRYGRAYMKNHLLIHAEEKKYVCQKCGKGFAQLSSLRSHQLLEEDVRKFVCNVCGMRFVLSSRFHSHMKTHLEDLPFKCEDCGRGYGYVWQLRQHRVRHSDVRPYACEQCGRAYKTMKHLRQHYAVHNRDLAAKVCETLVKEEDEDAFAPDDQWSAKPNWISGLRLVRVEKPYEPLARKCVVCHGDVRVSAANDVLCATCLRKEPKLLRLPPSETPGPSTTLRKYLGGGETGAQLQCDKCDFACDPLSQLFLAHLGAHAAKPKQTAHADAVECAKCRRTFAGKPSLIRHLRQHQPKRYSCSSCASAFRSLAQLKTHRKRHARVSLNRTHIFCDVCNKYFKSKKGFAYHQQKICVRFKCYICDLTFADASAMAAHSNANHNREPKAPARVAPDERTSEGSAQYADESPIVDVAPAQPDTVEDERCKEAPAKSQCSVCGKVVTAAVLPRHMILHTDAEPFTCALCGKSFKRKCSLQDHIMIEMGMKNYVCDVCGMKFLKQGYLNKHMNYHRLANGEFSGWACEQCGKRFSEKWRLGVHQRAVHKGGRFASCKCDICGKLFAERYMVRVHKHREHNGEELREHRCEVCDRRFVEQWMLRSHQRTAHRDGARRVYCELCGRTDHKAAECAHRLQLQQVTCALCGDAFATNGALREHVVSAHVAPDEGVAEPERSPEPEPTDDVLWVCAGCGQHCASKQQLRAHQQRNNCGKSERYDCGRCKRTFTSRCSLSNHAMLHHKESARLPFRCEFCAKEFAAEESLQLHLRLEKVCSLCDGVYPCNDLLKNHVFGEHNDDEADEAQSSAKPFRCKLCGKKFMRKQAMKNHMFAEMNLRRYVCEFCDKSYNYYSHLKEHLVSCHGEKEFLCGYCGKDFPTKKRFRDHVTLHSDEKPYACECGQTFKLPRYLNKHKKNCKLTNFGSIRSETVEILEVK